MEKILGMTDRVVHHLPLVSALWVRAPSMTELRESGSQLQGCDAAQLGTYLGIYLLRRYFGYRPGRETRDWIRLTITGNELAHHPVS